MDEEPIYQYFVCVCGQVSTDDFCRRCLRKGRELTKVDTGRALLVSLFGALASLLADVQHFDAERKLERISQWFVWAQECVREGREVPVPWGKVKPWRVGRRA